MNHQNKFIPKAVLTKTGIFPVNAARKVNTARPIVNEIRPRNNFYKSHSPVRRPSNRTTAPKANFANHKVNTAWDKIVSAVGGNRETAVKASAGCNWRSKRHYWNKVSKYNSGSNSSKNDDPQKALKNKRIVDSRCSRHMTRNKAYLVEYQDYNGGPVAFGGSKGNPQLEVVNFLAGDISHGSARSKQLWLLLLQRQSMLLLPTAVGKYCGFRIKC
ncbi:hypothetical protein Tco_1462226 [Tanacetum coccineum]